MAHIKKNDKVIVLTGKDKGKTGEVLKVLTKEDRVLVSGVNIMARHSKQSAKSAGGITRTEHSIHISNVAHVDPKTNKGTRAGIKTLKNGEKSLIARGSKEEIRKA